MTLAQIISTLTSPVAVLIVCVILGLLVAPWLRAHQAQVDATTDAIQDARLRAAAEGVVRWLESDPEQALLPGLVQRQNGISALAAQLGISLGTAGPAIDAAYNRLVASGSLAIAPPPPAPVTPAAAAASPDLAALVDRLVGLLSGNTAAAPQNGPTAAAASPDTSQVAQAPTTQPAPPIVSPPELAAPIPDAAHG